MATPARTGENAAAIATLMVILFSTIVLGWALLYKCTDETLKPDDFAVQKCFSFIAVPKKEKAVVEDSDTGVDTLLMGGSTAGGILQKSNIDDDDEMMDPDSYKYLQDFDEMQTKLTSTVFTDIAATDIYNCAKICATNEVAFEDDEDDEDVEDVEDGTNVLTNLSMVLTAGTSTTTLDYVPECGGFTSQYEDPTPDDGRVSCRLYKKGSLSDSGIASFSTTSFILK
jgi:hypothetical protein